MSKSTSHISKLKITIDESHHDVPKKHHPAKHQHSMDMSQQTLNPKHKTHHSHHDHHPQPSVPSLPIFNPDYDLVDSIYPFTMTDLNGHPVSLRKYEGHVCVVVNVASRSGFADHNYKLLNKLYEQYANSGLRILAFPCDQFNHTEYGSNREIKRFIEKRGVRFDVFSKININCRDSHPLWRYLKTTVQNTGNKYHLSVVTDPFTKFITTQRGVPIARLGSGVSEEEMIEVLDQLFRPKVLREKSIIRINLPPLVEEEDLPCMRSWHFKPGILKLV